MVGPISNRRLIIEKVARSLSDAKIEPVPFEARAKFPRHIWPIVALGPMLSDKVSKGAQEFFEAGKEFGFDVRRIPSELLEKRDRILARYKSKGWGKLWNDDGTPTRRHMELIMWGYSPDLYRVEDYIDRVIEEMGEPDHA